MSQQFSPPNKSSTPSYEIKNGAIHLTIPLSMLDVAGPNPMTLNITLNKSAGTDETAIAEKQSMKALQAAMGSLALKQSKWAVPADKASVTIAVAEPTMIRPTPPKGFPQFSPTAPDYLLQPSPPNGFQFSVTAPQYPPNSPDYWRTPGDKEAALLVKTSIAPTHTHVKNILDLPFEIRGRIFEMTLSDKFLRESRHCLLAIQQEDQWNSWPRCHIKDYDVQAKGLAVLDNANALRQVCKQIHMETSKLTTATPCLYFCTVSCFGSFSARFPRNLRSRVRATAVHMSHLETDILDVEKKFDNMQHVYTLEMHREYPGVWWDSNWEGKTLLFHGR